MRLVAVMMTTMVLLAGCAGSDESADSGPAQAAAREAAQGTSDEGAQGGADAPESGDGAAGDAALALGVGVGERIARDGTMRVRVEKDTFDRAFTQVVQLADRFGGTVLASDATTGDDGTTSGSVTLRVPAPEYDDLLIAAGRVGDVEQRSITSEDVSAEFVDLEARLRHNQAQERFYLSLLDRADSVRDAIAVQQRMDGIQQTIEQIQGRLRFLEERTSFSRLTVELVEVGGTLQAGNTAQPSFARYWATARAALVNVLGGALVVATVALPFVAAGLLILVLGRRYGPVRRRAVAPDA